MRLRLLAIAFALPCAAAAQTLGEIQGSVLDAQSGQPLAQALVAASGPALPAEESARTAADGSFTLPLLPPGSYTLNVSRDGYQATSAQRFTVTIGSTLRVRLSLLPAAVLAAPVSFEDQRPAPQAGGAETGSVILGDQLQLLPYGRETRGFEQALSSVAGVDNGRIYGAPAAQSRTLIDGVDVSSPLTGGQDTSLLVDFIDQIAVKAAGFSAACGRASGAIVDVVTKSGSDELHGSVFTHVTPLRSGLALDGGFELGGALQRGRLWFYGGLAPLAVDAGGSSRRFDYVGKLSYRIDADQSLSLSLFGDPGALHGSLPAGDPGTGGEDGALHYQAKLFDAAMLVEAAATWHRGTLLADGTVDLREGGVVKATHFFGAAGRHALQYGVDVERESAAGYVETSSAAFAQDSWTIAQVTFDAGLRVEDEREAGADTTAVLPRFGVSWDFTGRGLGRLYASAGRFAADLPLFQARGVYDDTVASGVSFQPFRDLLAALDYVHRQEDSAAAPQPVYDGATLSLGKRFSENYLVQASYTLSSARGAPEGFGAAPVPGLPPALLAASAPGLAADAPNAFKLDAAWVDELSPLTSLTFGALLRAFEGAALSGVRRLPWQTELDLRFAVTRALSPTYNLALDLDVLNVLDERVTTLTGPTRPLTARAGVRLSF